MFERWLTPGEAFPVATLDTAGGPVRVGVMICFDREFPESARALMLAGAELVLTPNACPLTDDRIGQFRARALENMLAVAMVNYPRFGDRSCAFDGIAFAPGTGVPRDTGWPKPGPARTSCRPAWTSVRSSPTGKRGRWQAPTANPAAMPLSRPPRRRSHRSPAPARAADSWPATRTTLVREVAPERPVMRGHYRSEPMLRSRT